MLVGNYLDKSTAKIANFELISYLERKDLEQNARVFKNRELQNRELRNRKLQGLPASPYVVHISKNTESNLAFKIKPRLQLAFKSHYQILDKDKIQTIGSSTEKW